MIKTNARINLFGFLILILSVILLTGAATAGSYISISKSIRSDFDNIIDVTTSNPNDFSVINQFFPY